MEIKERILETAGQLFREKGYSTVSMRDIAAALGISVGNLTYHFHKKQDIANALLSRELDALTSGGPVGLPTLDRSLRQMLRSLLSHAKIFGDPLLISVLKESQSESLQRIRSLNAEVLGQLRQLQTAGLIRPDHPGWQLEDLANILMAAHVGWLQQMRLEPWGEEEALDRAMRAQWTVVAPFLTEDGLRQLDALCGGKPQT